MAEVTIRGVKVGTCERKYATLPVTTMSSGAPLKLPLHILNGANPGPRLLLLSTSHGDEIPSIEIIRQVLDTVDLQKLFGTIVAIPCMNPIGLEWLTRNTPVDMYNMNRTFPGNSHGWVTEQMAAAISPICDEVDYMIDWHSGMYNVAINYVLLKRVPGELGEKVKELSFIYGLEYVYDGPMAGPKAAYAGTITDYMTSLGKVAIIPEVGGCVPLPDSVIENGVRGAFNVIRHIGMYPGEVVRPKEQWLLHDRPLLRPKHGGLFCPVQGHEMLNKVVPKGTVLARIRNPLTLEIIEEITAPCEQSLLLMQRSLLSKVHPGDYAYIIAELATAEKIVNK